MVTSFGILRMPRKGCNKTRSFLRTILQLLCLFLLGTLKERAVHCTIIPPKWANVTINPCAQQSWQLLYWPIDRQCYHIFAQGPCEVTQEFYYDEQLEMPTCRCSRGTLWHLLSRKCHVEYSRGPCADREYIAERKAKSRLGECFQYEDCPPGLLFWPKTKKCYPLMSKGPCLHGHLFYLNPLTGVMDCGCEESIMSNNYWPYERSCHELYTRGPCIQGHIFVFNVKTGKTECVCEPHLKTNYHPGTGRCYELNTQGPCPRGQIFSLRERTMEAECRCIPGYVKWFPTGHCYREYTQGPCPYEHFLRTQGPSDLGKCIPKTCLPGHLYDSKTDGCYPVGRRGPCPHGKIWVFERATSVRGMCHCDPHLLGYWPQHDLCYELGEKGPCPRRKVLSYKKEDQSLVCRCDYRRGFVDWTNGRCLKMGIMRKRLQPLIEPSEDTIQGNSILSKRIHRGLALPLREGFRNATSQSTISPVQELQVLNDIQRNIKNKTCGDGLFDKNKCSHDLGKKKKITPNNPKQTSPNDEQNNKKITNMTNFEALKITSEISKISSKVSRTSSQPKPTTTTFVRATRRPFSREKTFGRLEKNQKGKGKEPLDLALKPPSKQKNFSERIASPHDEKEELENLIATPTNVIKEPTSGTQPTVKAKIIPSSVDKEVETTLRAENPKVRQRTFKRTFKAPKKNSDGEAARERIRSLWSRKEMKKKTLPQETKDLLQEILRRRLNKISRRKANAREEVLRRRQQRQRPTNRHVRSGRTRLAEGSSNPGLPNQPQSSTFSIRRRWV